MFVLVEYLSDFVLLVPGPTHKFSACAPRFISSNRVDFIRASETCAAAKASRDLTVNIIVLPFALNSQVLVLFALNVYYYVDLIYALYIWFQSPPLILVGIYHWRERLLDLSFLGLFVGSFTGIVTFLSFAYLYYV